MSDMTDDAAVLRRAAEVIAGRKQEWIYTTKCMLEMAREIEAKRAHHAALLARRGSAAGCIVGKLAM